MEFELPSLPGGLSHLPGGLGPHNDRGFGVFASPHPRFRELDFCRPKSGSSTITIKDVDRHMHMHIDDLTRLRKSFKKPKEKVVATIEEPASKEVTESVTNDKEEDHAENEVKENVEFEIEEDVSALDIFKEVEKPSFEASHEKQDALDEEPDDLSENLVQVEKPGPKSSYTPQTGAEVSEIGSAEVGGV